jgi:hypothetical protein
LKNKVIKPCPDSRREGVDYFFFFKGSIYLSIYLSIILGFELGASHVNKKKKEFTERAGSQALVAHSCNPSYPGGSDQQDCSSKPAWGNSS